MAESSLQTLKVSLLVTFIYRLQTVYRLFGLQLQPRHHESDGKNWIVEAVHSVSVHHPCRPDPMTEVNTSR